MGYLFAFERLEVWQLARKFFKYSYSLIDTFPSSERFNLVDQIRRAATSIALNLAEMTSRSCIRSKPIILKSLTVLPLKFIVLFSCHTTWVISINNNWKNSKKESANSPTKSTRSKTANIKERNNPTNNHHPTKTTIKQLNNKQLNNENSGCN